MKRSDELRHEMVICPKCKKTCIMGNDDDRQQLCGACGFSFRADNTFTITDEELRQMYATRERFDRGGWTAFGDLKKSHDPE